MIDTNQNNWHSNSSDASTVPPSNDLVGCTYLMDEESRTNLFEGYGMTMNGTNAIHYYILQHYLDAHAIGFKEPPHPGGRYQAVWPLLQPILFW